MRILLNYLKVGFLNTIIGFLVIMLCINSFDLNYNISYFLGYTIGLINSFIFNKHYTFKSNAKWTKELVPFLSVFAISYSLSHIFLYLIIELIGLKVIFGIILSMIIYIITGYILNKKVLLSLSNMIKFYSHSFSQAIHM